MKIFIVLLVLFGVPAFLVGGTVLIVRGVVWLRDWWQGLDEDGRRDWRPCDAAWDGVDE